MSNIYTDIKKQCEKIDYEVIHIEEIADAYYITGNKVMYNTLSKKCENLRSIAKKIENIITTNTDENFKAAQKEMGNILNTLAEKI